MFPSMFHVPDGATSTALTMLLDSYWCMSQDTHKNIPARLDKII